MRGNLKKKIKKIYLIMSTSMGKNQLIYIMKVMTQIRNAELSIIANIYGHQKVYSRIFLLMLLLLIVLTCITPIPNNIIFIYEGERHILNSWGGYKQTVRAMLVSVIGSSLKT